MNMLRKGFHTLNYTSNMQILRSLSSKRNYNIKNDLNIFIRHPITQYKSELGKHIVSNVVENIHNVQFDNDLNVNPIFLNRDDFEETEKNYDKLRNDRFLKINSTDVFVFIYDDNALSVSGGMELGYWLAKQEEYSFYNDNNYHTVIILLNTMTTRLLKRLPNTTYIQLNSDMNYLDDKETNFPNLIQPHMYKDLTHEFTKILNKIDK